jgi:DNA-directed RNA polymerase specialized sigma24 family protein
MINKEELIKLHVEDGLTYKEVAKKLSTTMHNVRTL